MTMKVSKKRIREIVAQVVERCEKDAIRHPTRVVNEEKMELAQELVRAGIEEAQANG